VAVVQEAVVMVIILILSVQQVLVLTLVQVVLELLVQLQAPFMVVAAAVGLLLMLLLQDQGEMVAAEQVEKVQREPMELPTLVVVAAVVDSMLAQLIKLDKVDLGL
jgi:hypothetical protein